MYEKRGPFRITPPCRVWLEVAADGTINTSRISFKEDYARSLFRIRHGYGRFSGCTLQPFDLVPARKDARDDGE